MENSNAFYQAAFGDNKEIFKDKNITQADVKALYPEIFIKNTSRSRRECLKSSDVRRKSNVRVSNNGNVDIYISNSVMHRDAVNRGRYASKLARGVRQFFYRWFESLLIDSKAIERDIRRLLNSSLFDANWYREKYKITGSDEIVAKHYLLEGYKHLNDPSADFSTQFYVTQYSDVAGAPINPLIHYLVNGQLEKRKIKPSGVEGASCA